jgi:flagellar protein FlaJ
MIGVKGASENIRSYLLRLSDALRSGEPLSDFLAREAEVQAEDYRNEYERNLEGLKQWTNAYSSITISVGLIIIIQMITSMIYSTSVTSMAGLVAAGAVMAGFGAWIIYRSAPRETMNVPPHLGSPEQRRAARMFRIMLPTAILVSGIVLVLSGNVGIALIIAAACLVPLGIASLISDRSVTKKDIEFSTFLRSTGAMATSSGTTLKQALTKIDLASFPYLAADIERLSKRLQARVDPEVCWNKFGIETGSRLISDMVDIFYGAIKIGGDPERVGYLCSLFSARTTQLRAKRRLIAGTFSGLSTVMVTMVAALMVFVLAVVNNFATIVMELSPSTTDSAMSGTPAMSLGLAEFTPDDLAFLAMITAGMVISIAVASAAAVIFCDGGMKLKVFLYLALTTFISGVCFIVVPPMVASILKQ